QTDGFTFLFVINLQLPRSFTKTGCAASVVLYWGVPVDCLVGAGKNPVEACPPPRPMPPSSPPSSSCLSFSTSSSTSATAATAAAAAAAAASGAAFPSPALSPFERELLMRYIDLPFNRMDHKGSGFVSDSAAGGGGGGARGLPGFSAVDEDESESGVFSDKDFRNMSLKVVTSVVEGRWTVRKAVDEGNSQVLSRKLNQRYFRGSLYMETDVEVGSSVAAESVVGVCLTEPCVLDVGFFLEGGPRVLGCVRISQLKLALAEPLLFDSRLPPTLLPTPAISQPNTPSGVGSGGLGGAAGVSPTTAAAGVVEGRGSHFDPSSTNKPRPPPPPAEEKGAMSLGNPQFLDTWEDNGDSHAFRVRGPGYLSGGGKEDAGKPFGRFVRADLYKV
ncbi:unnamed protein product, partial [Laminaria digitata]